VMRIRRSGKGGGCCFLAFGYYRSLSTLLQCLPRCWIHRSSLCRTPGVRGMPDSKSPYGRYERCLQPSNFSILLRTPIARAYRPLQISLSFKRCLRAHKVHMPEWLAQ
jgi:hypothetical protein